MDEKGAKDFSLRIPSFPSLAPNFKIISRDGILRYIILLATNVNEDGTEGFPLSEVRI